MRRKKEREKPVFSRNRNAKATTDAAAAAGVSPPPVIGRLWKEEEPTTIMPRRGGVRYVLSATRHLLPTGAKPTRIAMQIVNLIKQLLLHEVGGGGGWETTRTATEMTKNTCSLVELRL